MGGPPGRGAALDPDFAGATNDQDYVGVILGTFTFFVWVLIGFMHWFG
jgi:hypothetical protein